MVELTLAERSNYVSLVGEGGIKGEWPHRSYLLDDVVQGQEVLHHEFSLVFGDRILRRLLARGLPDNLGLVRRQNVQRAVHELEQVLHLFTVDERRALQSKRKWRVRTAIQWLGGGC